MTDITDTQIEPKGHWFSFEGGIGDRHYYACECGYKRHDKEKVLSHIAWEIAKLSTPNPIKSKE